MNEKPEIEVGKLPVITKFIYTLGVLPTSYLMSMTYQEQVTWLYNYLQTQVIPLLNTESAAIQELQTLYELLRTYVNDYFENIDVQEEINNKLEQMAEDGSLTVLIKKYVDPLIEVIDNKVNQIASGSPIPVSSISAMTDTSRIYLNTTDGNWYWYNGTTWIIGGVYQATEIENDSIEGVKLKLNTISPYSLIDVPIQATKDVFKFCRWIRGYRYYQGNLIPAEGYISTLEKVPIIPGATLSYSKPYTMESGEKIVAYREDGTYRVESAMPEEWKPALTYYVALTLKEEKFDSNLIVADLGKNYIDIPWLNLTDRIINKKLIVYGDSLWENCNGNFNYPNTPYNQSTDACYGYKQYLEELGLTIDNYAVSGTTAKTCAEHTGINFPTNITEEHANEYEGMIISFGRNDARIGLPIGTINDDNTNTFIGSIKYIIETMLSKNSKLKIFLWSLTQSDANGFGPDSVNSAGFKEIDYSNALYEIADKYSCTVVNMYRESGINMKNIETFTFEGVHLTNDGYKFTSQFYKNKMKNNL